MKKSQPVLTCSSLALLAGVLCFGGPAGAEDTKDPRGLWLRQEGGVRFSFYDCGELLCAKVIGAQRAEDQAGIGTVILRGAKNGRQRMAGQAFQLGRREDLRRLYHR